MRVLIPDASAKVLRMCVMRVLQIGRNRQTAGLLNECPRCRNGSVRGIGLRRRRDILTCLRQDNLRLRPSDSLRCK